MALSSTFLSERHYKAIGLVAAEWSWAEQQLEQLIWEVVQINGEKGRALTTHLSSETRINILATLANTELSNTLKVELAGMVGRLRNLRTERNNIVHALWLSREPLRMGLIKSAMKRGRKPTPDLIKITAKGKLVISNKPFTAKQILSVAHEISRLVMDLYDLQLRIQNERQSGGTGFSKP